MVLDTHTHAWGPPSEERPWVNAEIIEFVDDFDVDFVYDREALLADMDDAGVDEAVVVGYPIVEWTDNRYTIEVVEEHDRLSGIVMIDQFAADAGDVLREAMAVDGILGFRLGAACPYDRMWETFDTSTTWLRDALDVTEFWEAAHDTDAVVQTFAHEDQLDQAVDLVETYPDLTHLFDHWFHWDPARGLDDEQVEQYETLAENGNVAIKISEVPHISNEAFPYADVHDHLRWLLDLFGRERVIWGSDYPNVSDVATYEESLSWLDHVDELSPVDRRWLTERSFESHIG